MCVSVYMIFAQVNVNIQQQCSMWYFDTADNKKEKQWF